MLARRRKRERGEHRYTELQRERKFLNDLLNPSKRKRVGDADQLVAVQAPEKRDELNRNTPMWLALRDKEKDSADVTVCVEQSAIFWLGYFIRKLMHEEH